MLTAPLTVGLFFFIGFATALISGIFGLLGGMILMVILLTLLSLPAAMLMSALAQLLSNGWRCWLWRKHIVWRLLPPYVTGMLLALGFLTFVSFVPSKALAFLLMGVLPLLAMVLRPWIKVTIENKVHNFFGAMFLTVLQLTAGALGPLLDLLYVSTPLTRQQIISTKAFTQAGMHVMRLLYYGTLGALIHGTFDWPDDLPWQVIVACLLGVVLGTLSSVQIINRMSDKRFKQILQTLILLVSLYSLGKAWALWGT